MLCALSAVYTLLILDIVWVSLVYCPLLLMCGASAVKAAGSREKVKVHSCGHWGKSSKQLKPKKKEADHTLG